MPQKLARRVDETLKALREDSKELGLRYNMGHRRRECRLILHNEGTSPAEGVVVYLHSNRRVKLLNFAVLARETLPISSHLIDTAQTLIKLANEVAEDPDAFDYLERNPGLAMIALDSLSDMSILPPLSSQVVRPAIEYSYSSGDFRVDLRDPLKHGFCLSLTRTHDYAADFIVGNLEVGEEGTIEYTVHADNLSEPTSGKLKVRGVGSSDR